MAAGFLYAHELLREEGGADAFEDARFDGTHGRYLSLVTVVNGTVPEEDGNDPVPYSWIAAALRASTPEA